MRTASKIAMLVLPTIGFSFRNEKATQWEGGFCVPTAIRWPGVIKPGTVNNEIGAREDMLPTLLAGVGDSNVKEELLKGKKIGDRSMRTRLLD